MTQGDCESVGDSSIKMTMTLTGNDSTRKNSTISTPCLYSSSSPSSSVPLPPSESAETLISLTISATPSNNCSDVDHRNDGSFLSGPITGKKRAVKIVPTMTTTTTTTSSSELLKEESECDKNNESNDKQQHISPTSATAFHLTSQHHQTPEEQQRDEQQGLEHFPNLPQNAIVPYVSSSMTASSYPYTSNHQTYHNRSFTNDHYSYIGAYYQYPYHQPQHHHHQQHPNPQQLLSLQHRYDQHQHHQQSQQQQHYYPPSVGQSYPYFEVVPRNVPSRSWLEIDVVDDLDRMLLHEDFPTLLVLAVKLKKGRHYIHLECEQTHQERIKKEGVPSSPRRLASTSSSLPSFTKCLPDSSLKPKEVMDAVIRMHKKLLSSKATKAKDRKMKVTRGQFPITDSMMDDSLETLQKELDVMEEFFGSKIKLKKKDIPTSPTAIKPKGAPDCETKDECKGKTNKCGPSPLSRNGHSPVSRNLHSPALSRSSKSPKRGGIAIKYSKWQTDILMEWTINHIDQPFPNHKDIQLLMKQTGLTQTQVINWTTNIRKRNRKATCEGGKKPHHFIDFLFLKQDRELKEGITWNSEGKRVKPQTRDCSSAEPLGDDEEHSSDHGSDSTPELSDVDSPTPQMSQPPPFSVTVAAKKNGASSSRKKPPTAGFSGRRRQQDHKNTESPSILKHRFEDIDSSFDVSAMLRGPIVEYEENMEPLSLEEEVNHGLMVDFSSFWLDDRKRGSDTEVQREGNRAFFGPPPSLPTLSFDDQHLFSFDGDTERCQSALEETEADPELPVVELMSDEENTHTKKRGRAPSFDMDEDDLLGAENMSDWAADMGFNENDFGFEESV